MVGSLALAQQLQAEEDSAAQVAAQRREDRRAEESQQRDAAAQPRGGSQVQDARPSATFTAAQLQDIPNNAGAQYERKKKKNKEDCRIM